MILEGQVLQEITLPGYRPLALETITAFDQLGQVTPLEEGLDEGTLMLLGLEFEQMPEAESLEELEQQLSAAGIPAWAGYSHIVAADSGSRTVYLGWVKGLAWSGVIMGMLVLLVLIGGVIWALLPESVKNMIEMMVMVGVMFLMMKLVTPMLGSGDKEAKK